jgi:hypothetical protein
VLALDTVGTVLVNPEAGKAQPLLPPAAGQTPCTQTLTPGLSLVPQVTLGSVSRGSGCRYYAWTSSGPGATVVDSAPFGDAFAVAYVGPGRWIIGAKHATYAVADTVVTDLGLLEEPDEFVTDVAERYLVPTLSQTNDSTGVPVFSTISSDIAYRIPGQPEIGGAGFSSNGDTLFVAGLQTVTYPSPARLLALDATTGQILQQAPYDGLGWSYMVVEPNRPWIYLVGDGRIPITGTPAIGIEVIDRRTLAVVAHMEVPASASQLIKFDDIVFPALGANNTLYLIDINGWRSSPGPTRIYEFDLLP